MSTDWIARDARRMAERMPILEALIAAVPFPPDAADRCARCRRRHRRRHRGGARRVSRGAADAAGFLRAHAGARPREILERTTARSATCNATCTIRPGRRRSAGRSISWCPAIAIHHLKDLAAMAACYEAVHGLLKPGGCFLDYDHLRQFRRRAAAPAFDEGRGLQGRRSGLAQASDRGDQGGEVRPRCRSAAATGSTSGTR